VTNRKNFKERVRDRMRATGERYAAARKHVEAERLETLPLFRVRLSSSVPLEEAWVAVDPYERLAKVGEVYRKGGLGSLDDMGRVSRCGWEVPGCGTRVDPAGEVALPLAPGRYALMAGALGHATHARWVEFEPGTDALTVNLERLEKAKLTLEVRDSRGEPFRATNLFLPLRSRRCQGFAEATTDEEGTCTLFLEPGDFEIGASPDDDRERRADTVPVRLAKDGAEVRVELVIREPDERGIVCARVVDREGRAVPGARVTIETDEEPATTRDILLRLAEGRDLGNERPTGPDGRVRMTGFEPGAVTVLARSGFLGGHAGAVLEDGVAREVEVVLDQPLAVGHVKLFVRDAVNGRLVRSRLLVSTRREGDEHGHGEEWTGRTVQRHVERDGSQDGAVLLHDLEPGHYLIGAWSEAPYRNAPPETSYAIGRRELEVRAGETAEGALLLPRSEIFRVRVTGEAGPVRDGHLHVHRQGTPRSGQHDSRPIGDDGVAVVDGIERGYVLDVKVEDLPGHFAAPFEVRVESSETTLYLRGDGPRVRVLDTRRNPLERVHVSARVGEEWLRARTGPDGLARLHGETATQLSVHAEGFEPESLDLTLAPGEEREVVLTPTRAGARLSGCVHDEKGDPVRGARVTAYPGAGGDASFATTGRDGTFVLANVRPGRTRIDARRPGLASVRLAIDVAPGEDRSGLELVLVAGARLSGRVDGALPRRVHVCASYAGTKAGAHPTGTCTRVAEDGSFSFARLGPGKWLVECTDRETKAETSVTIELRAGEDRDDVVLPAP
jgi:hypothetical protein